MARNRRLYVGAYYVAPLLVDLLRNRQAKTRIRIYDILTEIALAKPLPKDCFVNDGPDLIELSTGLQKSAYGSTS